MKKRIRLSVLSFLFCLTGLSWAEVAVIVHPSTNFEVLSENDVSRLFLGKIKTFPSGERAVPVNLSEGSSVRNKFNEVVCKKNSSQYKAYWSQLVFTGKGTPPNDVGDDGAVKALIAANPNMIGYIDAEAVDATVKVVFRVP